MCGLGSVLPWPAWAGHGCGAVGPPTTYNTGMPYVRALAGSPGCCTAPSGSLLTSLAQVVGPLPPVWEAWLELPPDGCLEPRPFGE